LDSDQELVGRIEQRDGQALELLMQRHGPAVRGNLVRMLKDDSAAEDIFQEVCLRLWEKADQWRGEGPLRAWLTRTATNLALNHIRGVRRRRQRPLEMPPRDPQRDDEALVPSWMIDESALEPGEIVSGDEQRAILRELLRELPDGKREVLQMIHEQDMPPAEVARVLGIPLGTVKSRLHYACRMLGKRWLDIQGNGSEWL
jgi:RNA polymerase sigma factor (sigma-70 family)